MQPYIQFNYTMYSVVIYCASHTHTINNIIQHALFIYTKNKHTHILICYPRGGLT